MGGVLGESYIHDRFDVLEWLAAGGVTNHVVDACHLLGILDNRTPGFLSFSLQAFRVRISMALFT
ncbi:hypothetical protein [Streptomyces sulphureus]|uniref:hypothetical protein n=1 Tax=Streptomyces sulphureus TaxID=47758 RepID=UPI001319C8DA|nr:hypothetical protein [Streptomyces sulphureus]